jgi:uncharacterized protein YkwD
MHIFRDLSLLRGWNDRTMIGMMGRSSSILRRAAMMVLVALGGCTVYHTVPVPGTAPASRAETREMVATAREREVAALLTGDRGQQRPHLAWNPILAKVARARAEDMAARGYFAHVNPDGVGPNTLVERAGYHLPEQYDHRLAGNNIESAAEGYRSGAVAWRHWMGSPMHRSHLLGLTPQFREQTEFGVGYAERPGSRAGSYWVVLIARPAQADPISR